MTDIDTMTPAELDEWAGRVQGWYKEIYPYDGKEYWWDDHGGKHTVCLVADWHPSTSWADLGVFYEWMKGEGWNSNHDSFAGKWLWYKYRAYEAWDPDLKTAALKAGWLAIGDNNG